MSMIPTNSFRWVKRSMNEFPGPTKVGISAGGMMMFVLQQKWVDIEPTEDCVDHKWTEWRYVEFDENG